MSDTFDHELEAFDRFDNGECDWLDDEENNEETEHE